MLDTVFRYAEHFRIAGKSLYQKLWVSQVAKDDVIWRHFGWKKSCTCPNPWKNFSVLGHF